MIRVETDVADDWEGGPDWAALADAAVRAAVGASGHSGLLESGITIEVSVKLAGDEEVRALNASFRAKDKPTNVLSFSMLESALIESLRRVAGGEALLGDVILARGVCAREAAERGVAIETHAAHLIVHGTLHLLGYDHESGDEGAEAMEETETRALAAIGIADPHVSEVRS